MNTEHAAFHWCSVTKLRRVDTAQHRCCHSLCVLSSTTRYVDCVACIVSENVAPSERQFVDVPMFVFPFVFFSLVSCIFSHTHIRLLIFEQRRVWIEQCAIFSSVGYSLRGTVVHHRYTHRRKNHSHLLFDENCIFANVYDCRLRFPKHYHLVNNITNF